MQICNFGTATQDFIQTSLFCLIFLRSLELIFSFVVQSFASALPYLQEFSFFPKKLLKTTCMFSRSLLIILFISLLSFNANSQSRKAQDLKKDYLQSSFLVINNYPSPLIKWELTTPIQYFFKGDLKYMSRKNWDRFITDLESLTGLEIIETNELQKAQISIHFSDLEDFAALEKIELPGVDLSHFDHWNSRKYNKQFQLERSAFCLVPNRITNNQRGTYNLQRLFLKSLGLLGDLDNEYSIFNTRQTDNNRTLSKNDKRLIKIHYLPGIKPGMNRIDVDTFLDKELDLEELLKEKV